MWGRKPPITPSHQRLMEQLYPLVRNFMGVLEGYDGENTERVNEFKEQLNELTLTPGIENRGVIIAELDDDVFDTKLPLVKMFIQVAWEIYTSEMEHVDRDYLRCMYENNLGAGVPKCLSMLLLLRRMMMSNHYHSNIMGSIRQGGVAIG